MKRDQDHGMRLYRKPDNPLSGLSWDEYLLPTISGRSL